MDKVKGLVKQLLIMPLAIVSCDIIFRFLTGQVLGQDIDSINVGFPLYYMIVSFLYVGEQSYLGDFKKNLLSGVTRKNYIASQLATIVLATIMASIIYVLWLAITQNVDLAGALKVFLYYFTILLVINTICTLLSGFGYMYSTKKMPFIILVIMSAIFFASKDFFAYTMPMAITGFANNYMSIFLLIGVLASTILFLASSKIMMSLDIKQ